MALSKLDILSQLPRLVWRGIEVPCQANSVSFEHGQVPHRQPGVDGAHVEHTGRAEAHMSFRIPFRAGIMEYKDLYPKRFRDFWNACLDGSTGTLYHPEFGGMDAKVKSYALHVDPNARDGYDVDVVWMETTESDVTIGSSPYRAIREAVFIAGELESKLGAVKPPIKYNDGSERSLLETLKQLEGMAFMAQLAVGNIMTQCEGAINAVNDMIDTANSSLDPNTWQVLEGLKRIESALWEAKNSIVSLAKRIQFMTAPATILVVDAANKAGMTIEDFLKANPRLATSRTIKAGTEYFVHV